MQIYLKHSEHGYKIAEMQPEAENDKKNGWLEVTKEQFYDRRKPQEKITEFGKKRGPKPKGLDNVNSLTDN